MATLLKILTAIPGVIAGVKTILEIFTRYFPPKSREERAVDKYKRTVNDLRNTQLETSKKIKEAKLGKTQAVERIINKRR